MHLRFKIKLLTNKKFLFLSLCYTIFMTGKNFATIPRGDFAHGSGRIANVGDCGYGIEAQLEKHNWCVFGYFREAYL